MNDELAALCARLREHRASNLYPRGDNGDAIAPDGYPAWDDSPAADMARAWCLALLEAAEADGHGGCRLCRS